MNLDLNNILLIAINASLQAGNEILSVYNTDFSVENKGDNSPLTLADRKSHEIIVQYLSSNPETKDIPVLSEEGSDIPYEERKHWEYFWLLDPLDGTKEFIKRNGEFTVNIALIHHKRPILGVVYIPINNTLYFSVEKVGAYKLNVSKDLSSETEALLFEFDFDKLLNISQKLPLSNQRSESKCIIVASRSHMNKETERYIVDLKKQHNEIEIIYAGSSLKICLVAEGKADIYPRLGPTMEWDTAAAHAVVNAAVKSVFDYNRDVELTYNKPDLKNPWFVVK